MSTYVQASLAGGEVSPALFGRIDTAMYQTSLKDCTNFLVRPYGGVRNRPGFRMVNAAKDSSSLIRVIPFVYNVEQAYVLEFGNQYMRVYRDGGQVNLPSTPAAWVTSTAYVAGQHVSDGGTNYYCRTSHTSGTFATDLADGKWYALTGTIVEIPTPWYDGDLAKLRFTQSADVLTVTHEDYLQAQITRASDSSWTCTDFAPEFGPFEKINDDTSVTVFASAVSGSIMVTANAGIFASGDVGKLFYIGQKDWGQAWKSGETIGAAGIIRRVGGNYYASKASGTTSTSMPQNIQDSWNDGGVDWAFLHPGFGILRITAYPAPVTESAYAGGTTYALDALVSYGGKCWKSLQGSNTGHQPDTSPTWWQDITNLRVSGTVIMRIPDAHIAGVTTYKWAFGTWNEEDGYPGCVTYHQQRQFFGGSPMAPQTVWGSCVDDFPNFGVHTPILDSDAVTYPLAGRQVNQVRHLVSLRGALLALTSDSIWTLVGDDLGGALTPSSVQAKVQFYVGANDVTPVTIGNQCIFVTDKNRAVRDLGYDYQSDSFQGTDLSALASHLLDGHAITDMAYQDTHGCVWMTRDDGLLLGMTYMRDQKVVAWHHHETDGAFESICVIPEGNEDVLYAAVNRTIDGTTTRFIERLEEWYHENQEDNFFLDCGLSYNGWNTTAATVTLSIDPVTGWDVDGAVTIEASSPIFSYPGTADQGDAIVFMTPGNKRLVLTILSTSSTTTARAVTNRLVPEGYRNTARADWGFGRIRLGGIGHLEGKTIGVLADGNALEPQVVSGGLIDLQSPSVVVHAGLPYTSSITTLDLSTFNGDTIRDKRKLVSAVRLQVSSTRGLKTGIPGKTLTEHKQRGAEPYSMPVNPSTGLIEIRVVGTWNDAGSVEIRQEYPLPAEILSVMPEVTLGGP